MILGIMQIETSSIQFKSNSSIKSISNILAPMLGHRMFITGVNHHCYTWCNIHTDIHLSFMTISACWSMMVKINLAKVFCTPNNIGLDTFPDIFIPNVVKLSKKPRNSRWTAGCRQTFRFHVNGNQSAGCSQFFFYLIL